jgi:hypothetical protein
MVNGRTGLSRVAAGRPGASCGWRLAARLALEWLPFRNGVGIGKDAAQQ